MLCTTTRKGIECFFMTKEGCSFNGGTCYEIVEKCEGCGNVMTIGAKKFCKVSPDPAAKWLMGPCNLATHIERHFAEPQRKVNPLKAAKRSATGKA